MAEYSESFISSLIKKVKDNTINNVAVPPGPDGVTFLKDVDIEFFHLINHI